jgi:hypothetical protein
VQILSLSSFSLPILFTINIRLLSYTSISNLLFPLR